MRAPRTERLTMTGEGEDGEIADPGEAEVDTVHEMCKA